MLLALLILLFGAPAQGAPRAAGFDVDDVAILFPRGYPLVPVTDQLWPEAAFRDVAAFAGGRDFGAEVRAAARRDPEVRAQLAANPGLAWRIAGGPVDLSDNPLALARANWRIVALRVDPCAGAVRERCHLELRLVAQVFDARGDDRDAAAHLVFRLGDDARAVKPLLDDLWALKELARAGGVPVAGQPLGIHPVLAAEAAAGGGPFGAAVRAFIARHTRGGPSVVTAAQLGAASSEWAFYQGKLVAGAWVPLPITGAGNHAASIRISGPDIDAGFVPAPAAAPSLHGLFARPPGAPLASADAALPWRVENPGRFGGRDAKLNTETTDCLSCHTTNNRIRALKLPASGARAALAALYVPAPGITGYPGDAPLRSAAAAEFTSFRAFGWFAGAPAVSMRTVNEAAESARYFNETVLPAVYGGRFAHPGFECRPGAAAAARRELHGRLVDCLALGDEKFGVCAARFCGER